MSFLPSTVESLLIMWLVITVSLIGIVFNRLRADNLLP